MKLPRNVDTPIEQGRRREITAGRQLGMRPHLASGALHQKADMSDDDSVVEYKYVPKALTHTIDLGTLWDTLREAERLGKDAYYIIEFPGLTVRGKITRS